MIKKRNYIKHNTKIIKSSRKIKMMKLIKMIKKEKLTKDYANYCQKIYKRKTNMNLLIQKK